MNVNDSSVPAVYNVIDAISIIAQPATITKLHCRSIDSTVVFPLMP